MAEEATSGDRELEGEMANAILAAINSMKAEFSSWFDGIGTAIDEMRKEMGDFTECVSQVELRDKNALIGVERQGYGG